MAPLTKENDQFDWNQVSADLAVNLKQFYVKAQRRKDSIGRTARQCEWK